MAAGSRARSPIVPRRNLSRYDEYGSYDEAEAAAAEEDYPRVDFSCPYCGEGFDAIGLCCHIEDEHHVEAQNGVCPVCQVRIGMDMAVHVTVEHGNYYTNQRRRYRKGSPGAHPAIQLFRKELHNGNHHSFIGSSSYTAAPSNAASELSTFMNLSVDVSSQDKRPLSLEKGSMLNIISDEKVVESAKPVLSDKDQKERAQRSRFVEGLLLSTIFDPS